MLINEAFLRPRSAPKSGLKHFEKSKTDLLDFTNENEFQRELTQLIGIKSDTTTRDLILNTEINKIRAMDRTYSSKIRTLKQKSSMLSEDEKAAVLSRFKRNVRKVVVILKMLEIHKIQMQRMLQKETEHWIHKQFSVWVNFYLFFFLISKIFCSLEICVLISLNVVNNFYF